MPISDGPVGPETLVEWGHGLHRPECVLASPSGDVFVPDWRGGVTVIRRDGSQHTWLARPSGIDLRPNAIALAPDGSFLIANLGDDGGVWRLTTDGELSPFLAEIDGTKLPPANFVTVEPNGRAWISVSTRLRPRHLAWRPDVADGFVVVVDRQGARIVADGLHYTNEVRPDPSGSWLYVVETFARRIVRFPIHPDGALGPSEPLVTLGYGCFPDGFAFDEEDGLWVTSLISNRLLRIDDAGNVGVVMEDANAEWIAEVERAFATGTMTPQHLGPIPRTRLQQLTSIAFGDADRRTAFLGSLHSGCIHRFRAPVAGAPAEHWNLAFP